MEVLSGNYETPLKGVKHTYNGSLCFGIRFAQKDFWTHNKYGKYAPHAPC